MSASISRALCAWLTEKRLTREVARRLGKPSSTLAAELHGEKYRAKLGADDLVPLLQVVREMGYGPELKKILRRFVRELEGEQTMQVAAEAFSDLLLGVVQGIGELSKATARIDSMEGRKELTHLKTLIRGEIIPAVYKLEDIIDSRLEKAGRKPETSGSSESQPIPSGA